MFDSVPNRGDIDALGAKRLERRRACRNRPADGLGLISLQAREICTVPAWGDKEMAEVGLLAGERGNVEDNDTLFLEDKSSGNLRLPRLSRQTRHSDGAAFPSRSSGETQPRGWVQASRREAKASATSLPFARPLEVFMTWPNKNCATFSSPSR